MATLSFGGGRDCSDRAAGSGQHVMLETILRLKSQNQQDGNDNFLEDLHSQDLLDFCGIPASTKGLKRKRLLADTMSISGTERERIETELMLELGQIESSRGFAEGHSSGMALGLRPCNVLLQLGGMGEEDLHVTAGMSVGEGPGHIFDPVVQKQIGTHLRIGPPPPPPIPSSAGLIRTGDCEKASTLLRLGQCEKVMGNLLEGQMPVVDEGSTSARLVPGGCGYLPCLFMAPQKYLTPVAPISGSSSHMQVISAQEEEEEEAEEEDFEQQEFSKSMGAASTSCGTTTSTSGASGHLERPPKVCRFRGCSKGPRGASGLCIAHGGGRRCQKHGCNKGAEGRTVFCKAHGGGRRCQTLGCTKSAEGKTDYCIGHGGGRRCTHEGCDKAARGRSGLCIRHGGGKRCQIEGCTKSAEGYSGLCISHGGGRRCQFPACTKGAQGSTMFCKAHGGGKRCIIAGCNKGAEGSTPLCKGHCGGKRCAFDGGGICTKSVHGGTLYCVAHGGGKRCAVEGCAKSARGRTDFCVRHGGGKRCKVGCGKSAQGSTDFCKAHGGGKRCQWGVEGSAFSNMSINANGTTGSTTLCDKFARGKTGLCVAHSALVQDMRVHGGSVTAGPFTPGLAPGLFRGLVSGSGQSRLGTNTSFSSGVTTAVASGSRPAGSGSDLDTSSGLVGMSHVSSASDESGRQFARESTPATAASVEIWTKNGSGDSEKKSSYESGDNNSNSGHLNVSFKNPSSPSHSPFGSNNNTQMATTSTSMMGLGNFGIPTTGHNLDSPSRSQRSSSSSAGLLSFQQPLIPPQVLVPVSMQKETPTCPTYKQLNSITGEGVFNMSSLSLPEGRVHGGSLKSLFLRRGHHPSSQTESAGTFTLGMSSSLSIDMRQPTLITQEGLDATYTEDNSRIPQFGHSGLEKTDLNCSLSVDGNVLTSGVDLN